MNTIGDKIQNKVSETSVQTKINDIVIHVATANGSGSQSANTALLRSIFQMGIPVSGKNLFPSNIQGLPTWFTIRANKHGYVARRDQIDLLVAMNPETATDDLFKMQPGSLVVYDEPLKLDSLRDDIEFYPVPFNELVKEIVPNAKLRKLVRNIVYNGIVAKLIGIEMAEVEEAIRKQFPNKPKAAALNIQAAQIGFEFAAEKLPSQDKFRLERMDKTKGKIIIDGNAAAALGCLFAGVTVVTWYPITPSSSLIESLIDYLRRYRIDPETGKATFAVIQAEDEIAALGMVVGAGWAGARSMTATSGPGISLMSEFSGLAYFAEIPGVVFDVQRVGPSTGLPTRTMQGDLLSTAFLSHGDTKNVMLLPSSPEEIYEMAGQAFDLAEQLQSLVFVMSDLDLGMNNWMADPFRYPENPINRGKVLTAEQLEKLDDFGRYKDVDGDGIPYRTLAGTKHHKAPYFTRGTGHDEYARYSEDHQNFEVLLNRLNKKFETARKLVPKPVVEKMENAKFGIVAYGTSHYPIVEVRDALQKQHGLATDYLRLRAYPFTEELAAFIDQHEYVYVIDQNRDAQMYQLMKIDFGTKRIGKMRSLINFDGLPLSSDRVLSLILNEEKDSKNGR
ncbi:MAG: 2-oxoacid:acceptor oxidoreductase subunit alpha [Deferribacteres bacterium]|nr:2-oxoacid:acceptor oxidoreductase subunit alpha [candidate division KSB1 bacterium]MCB9512595.1 2-oxoacid:acceptor oxidoreductase subunit alpha [Deferribacteres bacterium]